MSGAGFSGGQFGPVPLIAAAFILGAIPLLFGICTAYLKISIVFGTIRSALGGQQVPGQMVTAALSFVVTLIVMAQPIDTTLTVLAAIDRRALAADPIETGKRVLRDAGGPWRDFLHRHAGRREIELFHRLIEERRLGGKLNPAVPMTEPPLPALGAAFMVSELKEAFVMAFALLVPFVLVDIVIANVLVGLGMSMVSPVMIALPLKLLLFTAADGWMALSEALVQSYRGG